MTDREKAIVMAHTGICMLAGEKFGVFHAYIEDIMGRPVYTHELAIQSISDEIKEKSRDDFMKLCMEEQEPCSAAISRQAVLDLIEHYNSDGLGSVFYGYEEGVKFADAVNKLPPVTPQPKTGHWIYRIYGEFHEQGDWYCSHCDYQFNYGNGHAKHCPECGYEMSEAPTEEVISEYDKRRGIKESHKYCGVL